MEYLLGFVWEFFGLAFLSECQWKMKLTAETGLGTVLTRRQFHGADAQPWGGTMGVSRRM